jgi:TRAP-type mannitol/chloroaromatic compound transport system substrate-binding protein
LAVKRLLAAGVQLHAYPKDVMTAARKIAFEIYEEEAGKNPGFKKIYEPWKAFRENELQWFRLAEADYANFLFEK